MPFRVLNSSIMAMPNRRGKSEPAHFQKSRSMRLSKKLSRKYYYGTLRSLILTPSSSFGFPARFWVRTGSYWVIDLISFFVLSFGIILMRFLFLLFLLARIIVALHLQIKVWAFEESLFFKYNVQIGKFGFQRSTFLFNDTFIGSKVNLAFRFGSLASPLKCAFVGFHSKVNVISCVHTSKCLKT